jgi:hypothetical protein
MTLFKLSNGLPKFSYAFSFILNRNQLFNYNCWSCNKELNESEVKQLFCPCKEKKILPSVENINYYELFEIEKNEYFLNTKKLTTIFRQKMAKIHPDLYTSSSDVNKY